MSSGQLKTVVKHIHKLAGEPEGAGANDAQLVERFVDRHEEEAFAALVQRHGPMVMGVCRRVLQNVHDAEDAFQAVFFIMAQRARSLRQPQALGCWLHEVAVRTSLRARSRALTRRQHEGRVENMAQQDFLETIVWRDLQPVLDEEVQRLPRLYRAAFVLCYLDGKTYEQAATQLGCRTGTISRRLARSRELLQKRLTQRGLTLPAGLLAAVLAQYVLPGPVSAALLSSTVSAALTGIASAAAGSGLTAQAAALVEEGSKAMVLSKSKLLTGALLLAGLLGVGAISGGRQVAQAPAVRPNSARSALNTTQEAPKVPKVERPVPPAQEQKPQVAAANAKSQATITFTGKVLDAKIKPVSKAFVAFLGRPKRMTQVDPEITFPEVLAQGQADATGEFKMAVPRIAAADYWELNLVAWGPGHALGVKRVPSDPRDSRWVVLMSQEKILHGRLVDLQRQSAAGVKVSITHLEGMSSIFQGHQSIEFNAPPTGLKAWPRPVTTDADGRFTVRGVGKDWMAVLSIADTQFAAQKLVVNPTGSIKYILDQDRRMGRAASSVDVSGKNTSQPFTWIGLPAQALEGTITQGDTGKPVPHARIIVYGSRGTYSAVMADRVEGQADASGKYRIVPRPGDHYILLVYPPKGEPYLLAKRQFVWKDSAALQRTEDMVMSPAVMVEGIVTEATSGRPVAGASVEYFAHPKDNPFFKRADLPIMSSQKQLGLSAADGTFRVPVLPGKGFLLITTATDKYTRVKVSPLELGTQHIPPHWHYPQGCVKLDLKLGTRTHALKVALRPALSVPVRLVGPNGEPVRQTLVVNPGHIRQGYTHEYPEPLRMTASEFTLNGLNWDSENVVYVYSSDKQLGARLRLTAEDAVRGPLNVKMQPCGTARVRLVDEKGKFMDGWKAELELVLSPGESRFKFEANKVAGEALPVGNLDLVRYGLLQPDAKGRFTLPSLIPGATYRVFVQARQGYLLGTDRTFTVEPGQTLDLGDVTVKTSF
jgi:RNA polymerase sigma factor (sigma-70 family)